MLLEEEDPVLELHYFLYFVLVALWQVVLLGVANIALFCVVLVFDKLS